jgi:hypothetical protein
MEGHVFGKPHWFRVKTIGWGLVPIRWQGWAYTASWIAVITLPFVLFLARHQSLEAMAWLTLAVGGLTYDVWHLVRAIRKPLAKRATNAGTTAPRRDDGVLYILDSRAG